MHLFNCKTRSLDHFFDDNAPPFAILSHTWGPDAEELSFQDMKRGDIGKPGIGSIKFQGCLEQAQADGLTHFWNDTFCIDKTNLVELAEAIQSMFRWYQRARMCYVYLADVKTDDARGPDSNFGASRWFTRGWTLQELLAPREVRFYNADWKLLGTRNSLCALIERATGIPRLFLLGITPLRAASVAQRMSWAARRETRREEDRAYSLLGIFDVSVPVIYGEGGEQAFWRLQDQIMRTTRDDSILAWGINNLAEHGEAPGKIVPGKVLAASPSDFADSGTIVYHERTGAPINNLELSGGSIRMRVRVENLENLGYWTVSLRCGPEDKPGYVICLRLVPAVNGGPDEYVRPSGWSTGIAVEPSSEQPTTLVHIRNNGDARASTVGPELQYVLYDEELADLGLEVMEVLPESSWDRERSLITSAVREGGLDAPCTLIRLRRDGLTMDFVLLLDFTPGAAAHSPRVGNSLMICLRDATLSSITDMRRFLRADHLESREASVGELHLRISLQSIPRQSIFVIRPERLPSPPRITVDISAQLEVVGSVLRLIYGLERESVRLEALDQWNRAHSGMFGELESLESQQRHLHAQISELQAKLRIVDDAIHDIKYGGDLRWRVMNLRKQRSVPKAEDLGGLWGDFRRTAQLSGPLMAADGSSLLEWAVGNKFDGLAEECRNKLNLKPGRQPESNENPDPITNASTTGREAGRAPPERDEPTEDFATQHFPSVAAAVTSVQAPVKKAKRESEAQSSNLYPVMIAVVLAGDYERVKAYLKSFKYRLTGSINASDDYGRTALWYAVNRDYKEIVKLLLDHGAETTINPRHGAAISQPADIAKKRKDVSMQKLLQRLD